MNRLHFFDPTVIDEALAASELDAATTAEKFCPCFPGTCRGGQVVNGALSNGLLCRRETADQRVKAQAAAISSLRSLPAAITEGCDALGLEAAPTPAQARQFAQAGREARWLPVAVVVTLALVSAFSHFWPWGFGK